MAEELLMADLAAELREQGKAIRQGQRTVSRHIRDCRKTTKETADKLKALDDRFETFDKASAFLRKYGRLTVGIVVTAFLSAFASQLVQNYLFHEQALQAAAAAQEQASIAAKATTKIAKTLNAN